MAAGWAAAAGVPDASPEQVLAPLVRVDCAAAFRAPPAAIVLLVFPSDAALAPAPANATRRLLAAAASAPPVSLTVTVTVLLVAALPFDATAAEIGAADATARTQAAAGVAAVRASAAAVFNATCATLSANVSLAVQAATRHVAPPETPVPGSAWAPLPLSPLALLGAAAGGLAFVAAAACGMLHLRRVAARRSVAARAAAERRNAHAVAAVTWPQRKAALQREQLQQQPQRRAAWRLPSRLPPPPCAVRDFDADVDEGGDVRADALLRLASKRHLAFITADTDLAPSSP